MLHGRDRLTGAPGTFEVVRCDGCGLAFTEPRLSPQALIPYYPTSYPSHEQTSDRRRGPIAFAGRSLNRARLEHAATRGPYRAVASRDPGRLLDVGCGTGGLGAVFRRRGWEVYGVEPSSEACGHAAASGIEVHCGRLEDAPWPDGSFDAVIFNHSLEHIPDPGDALRRARGLLRYGGLLVVSVPNFGCWQRRAFRGRWFQLDLPRHLQHFEHRTLRHLIEEAGLEPVESRTQSMLAGFIGSLQYALFGRLVLRGGTGALAGYASLPLLAISDLLKQGDCLTVVAKRRAGSGATFAAPALARSR